MDKRATMVSVVPFTSAGFLASTAVEFGRSTDRVARTAAELTSGRRILDDGFDTASLTAVQRLRSQVVRLEQSSRNVAQGESLASVASASLNNIQTQLTSAATLATSASGTDITDAQRAFAQQELTTLLAEIDQIAANTTFDGQALLDGNFTNVEIIVGAEAGDNITLSLPDTDSDGLFNGSLPDISNQADAATAVTQIATALATVNTARGDIEGARSRLSEAEDNIRTTLTGVNDATSALEDIDAQADLQRFALEQIQVDVASSVLAQTQRLSSDLLGVLNFNISENTGQESPDEALNSASDSLLSSAEDNVDSTIQAT